MAPRRCCRSRTRPRLGTSKAQSASSRHSNTSTFWKSRERDVGAMVTFEIGVIPGVPRKNEAASGFNAQRGIIDALLRTAVARDGFPVSSQSFSSRGKWAASQFPYVSLNILRTSFKVIASSPTQYRMGSLLSAAIVLSGSAMEEISSANTSKEAPTPSSSKLTTSPMLLTHIRYHLPTQTNRRCQ